MDRIFEDLRKHKIEHETVCNQCKHFDICNAVNIWSHTDIMDKICENSKST